MRMRGPGDVFLLTLFFPRSRWIPIKSIFRRLNPTFHVDYCGEEKEATLFMKVQPMVQVPMLRWNFRTKEYFLKKWKINGKIFRCCFDFNSKLTTPLIIFSTRDNNRWWEIISNHFFQMFPNNYGSQVAVTADTMSKVPKNQKVDIVEVRPGRYRELNAIEVERFLEAHPVIMAFIHPGIQGEFSENSILLTMENVILYNAHMFTPRHFYNFSGNNLLLRNSPITSIHINRFIVKWYLCNNTKLDSVWILGRDFDRETILAGLDVKPWNRTKRPAYYTPKSRLVRKSKTKFRNSQFRYVCPVDEYYDCTHAMDLERQSDNLVASIRVNPRRVIFYVWKP
ncbi:hypothetical protein CRE_07622 [Caenorhabditis remanei]|uniref:F-box associated domain-containing protein n=1 Tax=Caenorhabditis remanei TaxID=31234 RepID=E3MP99_CAERE|nr:hypothetical protein CRE_07622 [Caenorhabditis remanei]